MLFPRSGENVRAFVAVELPQEVRVVLRELIRRLRHDALPFLRLVDPERIHLTLKFLGEIPASTFPGITAALDQRVAGISPFEVQIQGLGGFPTLEAPRVLWVGIDGDPAPLQKLSNDIEAALNPLGFLPEKRPFTPHLTLARLREGRPPEERRWAGEFLMRFSGQERARLLVRGISLMRSTLRPEGALYTRLHHATLQGLVAPGPTH